VGCEDGILYRHTVSSAQEPPLVLAKHGDAISAVACSPDGERLATGGRDGFLKIWDTHSGEMLLSQPFPSPVNKVLFNQKGDRLLAVSGKQVWVWSVRRGRGQSTYQHAFLHPTPVIDAAWSPEGDGTYLAAVCENRTYCIWDADRRWGVFEGSAEGAPLSLAWSPLGVAIGTERGDVYVYTATTKRNLLAQVDLGQRVTALAWSPALDRWLAAITPQCIQVIDGSVARQLGEAHLPLGALALSHDGRSLATGSLDALRVYPLPIAAGGAGPWH
jgi:WD40 repeat protein